MVRVDAASRRMLRARDKMDRSYDKPLDVAALARVALTSEAHFIRTFCPGPIRSPMGEQEGDASVDVTPLRRRAEPEEIAAAVAFLASDDAIYMTGAELAVDGGYLAR